MTKWEYLYVICKTDYSSNPQSVTNELNEYGKDGWELINFQILENGSRHVAFKRVTFKKPKEEK